MMNLLQPQDLIFQVFCHLSAVYRLCSECISDNLYLLYKKQHFSKEKIEQNEQDKFDKEMGFKEYSASELRKRFKTHKTTDELVICEIKTKDSVVVIPEKIGNQKIVGIENKDCKEKYTNDYTETIICECDIKEIGEKAFYNYKEP